MRPGEYVEDAGWVGDDVWHAHCVHLNHDEIRLFGRTGTGVCHCPASNMRLASGIAPIRAMLDNNVKVGLGVDGAASNDAGHLLNEARLALLLQRVGGNPAGYPPVRGWPWLRWAVRRCWDATTSARWLQTWRQISLASGSIRLLSPVPSMIWSRRWSSANRSTSISR